MITINDAEEAYDLPANDWKGRCYESNRMIRKVAGAIQVTTYTIPDGTIVRLPDGSRATLLRHVTWDGVWMCEVGKSGYFEWENRLKVLATEIIEV